MAATAVEFERVEAIISRNCPLHGCHSTPHGPGAAEISMPVHGVVLHGDRGNHHGNGGRRSASANTGGGGRGSARTAPDDVATRRHAESRARDSPTDDGGGLTSDASSLADTQSIETIESPDPSPHTPAFGPTTPKAMVLFHDFELPTDAPLSAPTPGRKHEASAKLRCVERHLVNSLDRPKSATS
jgi:hypothetical protein